MTHEKDKKLRLGDVVLDLSHVHSLTCHIGLVRLQQHGESSSPGDLPSGPLQKSLLTLIEGLIFPGYF